MNIHGCISYASLQRTAGKHLARMLMKQTLSLSLFVLYYISLSHSLYLSLTLSPPSPSTLLTQHHHLSHLLSLSLSIFLPKPSISTSLSISPFLGLCMGGPLFLYTPTLSPPSPQSWGYWPTWQALMIIPITVRHPLPAWPRCLLIILLWSAQPEAWPTLSLLPFWPTNHSSHVTLCTL